MLDEVDGYGFGDGTAAAVLPGLVSGEGWIEMYEAIPGIYVAHFVAVE